MGGGVGGWVGGMGGCMAVEGRLARQIKGMKRSEGEIREGSGK